MPLGEGVFGTNADGTQNQEYCTFCFQNGAFTEPNLTVDQMIAESVKHMTTKLSFSSEKAEEMSRAVIPTLKRWMK